MIGCFEENSENKYLVLDNMDENKEEEIWRRNMKKFWEVLKKETETVNGGKRIEYRKDFLKK